MNFRLVFYIISYVMRYEGILMVLPVLIGIGYHEYREAGIFAGVAVVLLLISTGIWSFLRKEKRGHMKLREGYFIVAASWFLISFFSAVAFYLTGYFPGFADALFEAISGFTTTGATILRDVEILPKSVLFWRSFAHWFGGMGFLVFILGLMPGLDGSDVQLIKAESPGIAPGKLVPKLRDSSRILYLIYLAMTLVLAILLLCTGMPLFDSVVNALGTAGTGGFGLLNDGIGGYHNVPAEMIIAIFMLLFGVNFNIYYYMIKKQWSDVKENEELKVYWIVVAVSVVLIMINILPLVGGSWFESFRLSFFQVASIITTTGYGTADFNLWPSFSKAILVLLMFSGACGGSTGGGLKVIRFMVLFKSVKRELSRILHPNLVKNVRIDGHVLDSKLVHSVQVFFFAYMALIFGTTLIVSLDGFDMQTSFTAAISAISNIGPGLGAVGPMGNFADFSPLSKVILSLLMITGRLEIYPILVLLTPEAWKKKDF